MKNITRILSAALALCLLAALCLPARADGTQDCGAKLLAITFDDGPGKYTGALLDGLAERGAFIVDPDGKIQVYEVTAGGIGRNAKELLRLVQAAKFVREHGDQVCPAKWQPGAETLKPSLDLVGQL